MSKFVGFIVGAALVTVGVLTGNVALIVQGAAMIVTQAVVDLTAPKQPARQASEMTIALGEQPRVMLVGETFTPGSLVDGFDYGGKYGTDWEVLVIRLADEPCESLTGFYVDDTYVPYTGDGNYPQFDSHHFSLWFRADTSTVALPSVVTDHGPGWTSADIGGSGCDVIVAYLSDSPKAKHPAWPGGRPHFGFVVKGGKRYDPRKDDTVAGGSGSHRFDDPATWEWTENAVINWYGFERGVYVNGDTSDQTKLLVGRGLSAEESPPENIFAAANLCDDIAASVFPFQIIEPSDITTLNFSPDGTMAVVAGPSAGTFELWYVPTRSRIAGPTLTHGISGGIAVNNDGSFYSPGDNVTGMGVSLISPSGAITQVSPDEFARVRVIGDTIYGTPGLLLSNSAWVVGDPSTVVPLSFFASWYAEAVDGHAWAIGAPKINITTYGTGIGFYDLIDATTYSVTTAHAGAAYGLDNGAGGWFVLQAGFVYVVDKATQAIIHGPVSAPFISGGTGGYPEAPFRGARLGDPSIWIGYTRYSTLDLSILESVDPADWPSGTGSAGAVYDRVNNALWAAALADAGITIRFLDRNGGYRVAGPIYSTQEFIDVEGMFAAAVGGNIVTYEGGILLEPGQAKSVVATITDDDLLVGSEINWNQGFLSESDGEWVNTVVGTYIEPDQKWNSHNTPPLRDTADIVADGKPREATITLRLVRSAAQAMRVSEINRRLGRLWGRASVKLGPRFCELEAGDWISWTSARYFAGGSKTFRIDANNVDEKWQNQLTLREMSGSVYADDATFPTDHSVPTTSAPPPDIGTPADANWTLSAVTLDSPGASVPALHIEGSSDDDGYVEAIIFEYWLDDGVTDPTVDPDAIAWTSAGTYPPSTTVQDITSVVGAETYYAAVSYVVSGETGDRLVLGPVTLAGIGTGIRTADTTFITADDTTRKADLG